LSAAELVQLRILTVRLATCQNRPDRGHLADHRPAQLPVKRVADEKENKAPMVNLAGRREAERQLRLNAARGNQNAERKRDRKKHRHQDHDKFLLIVRPVPEQNSGAACFQW
jgi:hypothetical protein